MLASPPTKWPPRRKSGPTWQNFSFRQNFISFFSVFRSFLAFNRIFQTNFGLFWLFGQIFVFSTTFRSHKILLYTKSWPLGIKSGPFENVTIWRWPLACQLKNLKSAYGLQHCITVVHLIFPKIVIKLLYPHVEQ